MKDVPQGETENKIREFVTIYTHNKIRACLLNYLISFDIQYPVTQFYFESNCDRLWGEVFYVCKHAGIK